MKPRYQKPKKLKYTDLAIFIDHKIHHFQETNEPLTCDDVETIFKYLYQLFYSLSVKSMFFNSEDDYDKYSLYGATQTYQRLINRNIEPIKSVLNFIKKVLYPFKVNYQQDNFYKVYTNDYINNNIQENIKDDNITRIKEKAHDLTNIDIEIYLNSITSVIKDFLKESPYSNNPVIIKNIYISCLLTFLRSITISNENKKRLYFKNNDNYKPNIDLTLEKIYYEEALYAPITWYLDSKMENYIAVLTNKIKKLIAQDIRDVIQIHEPSEDIIMDILMSPMEDNKGEDDE